MIRTWDVQVTLLHEERKLAQTAVTVNALNPGEACPFAYVVVRDDFKLAKAAGQPFPKVTAVHFLVRVNKEKQTT